jgi:hypothetical protein
LTNLPSATNANRRRHQKGPDKSSPDKQSRLDAVISANKRSGTYRRE